MSCRTVVTGLVFFGGIVMGVVLSLLFFVHQKDTSQETRLRDATGESNVWRDVRVAKSGRQTRAHVFDLKNMESKKFLFTEYAPKHRPVELEHPTHLRDEYKRRKTVFVGVLSSQMYLATRAKAIYDTWAPGVSMMVFFVGQDCIVPPELNYLPIVKLDGVPDGRYPPFIKAFAVMQYMYDHYVNDYDWFIRADDDVYMRGRKLIDLLNSFNADDMISLGRAGMGKDEDMGRLQLLKHERYCMGGPGMIFSRALMEALGPYLDLCVKAIGYHDERNLDAPWNDDDVEIGRCISRELDVQCSTSHEGRIYFYFDYTGDCLDTQKLWENPIFRDVITIHPVKDPSRIRSLHLFYLTLEYEELYLRKQEVERSLTTLCSNLGSDLVPKSFLATQCAVEFAFSHVYDGTEPNYPVKRLVHKHHKVKW